MEEASSALEASPQIFSIGLAIWNRSSEIISLPCISLQDIPFIESMPLTNSKVVYR